MKNIIRTIFAFFILQAFIFTTAQAQDPTDPNVPCDVNDPIGMDCPLDGGVIALLAIGVVFGIKKLAVK